jgi:hypothetical protein
MKPYPLGLNEVVFYSFLVYSPNENFKGTFEFLADTLTYPCISW